MADYTSIEWTDHTFNVWEGCAPVSPGCRFCYARRDSKRWNVTDLWRRKGPRKFRSEEYWRKPVRWNRTASRAGRRARVFCASMADVFEHHPVPAINTQMDAARTRLWALIAATPWLDWQLLTKRPQNVAAMVPWDTSGWPANVWLGTSVEDQTRADERLPILCGLPAAVRFLSCEPLLGPTDVTPWLVCDHLSSTGAGEPGLWECDHCHALERITVVDGFVVGRALVRPGRLVHWVIAGGESGPKARPMHPWWVSDLRHQCTNAGVPFLFKQWGEWRPTDDPRRETTRARYVDHHGQVHDQPAGLIPWPVVKAGKTAAGRVLDGQTWNQFPVSRNALPALARLEVPNR